MALSWYALSNPILGTTSKITSFSTRAFNIKMVYLLTAMERKEMANNKVANGVVGDKSSHVDIKSWFPERSNLWILSRLPLVISVSRYTVES